LTDAQWRRLEPYLPPEKPWTGHPNAPHQRIINGILWILRTGAPWRDLPERYGPVGTVSRWGNGPAAGIGSQGGRPSD
jgi:transposase